MHSKFSTQFEVTDKNLQLCLAAFFEGLAISGSTFTSEDFRRIAREIRKDATTT